MAMRAKAEEGSALHAARKDARKSAGRIAVSRGDTFLGRIASGLEWTLLMAMDPTENAGHGWVTETPTAMAKSRAQTAF